MWGNPTCLDIEEVLSKTILTFNPIGNAQGRERAPVLYWDGSKYSNDEFWCWMRGEDPDNPGHMWKRLDIWDSREEKIEKEVLSTMDAVQRMLVAPEPSANDCTPTKP